MKTQFLILFSMLVISFCNCRSQTNEEKIMQTASRAIAALQAGDSSAFIKLIGLTDLGVMGKDEEMVGPDVRKYQGLLKRYFDKKEPNILITDLYNKLGQKNVRLLFYEHRDSSASELHLNLLFGPPNIIPLNKISGYELVENHRDSLEFRPYSFWKTR